MPAVKVGMSGAVWGTVGDAEIIVDNIREANEGERTVLEDGQGDKVGAVYHGNEGQVTMDFILRNGAAASYLLTRGASLTLPTGETHIANGKTLYLESWEKSKEKNGFLSGRLTANHYPNLS